MLTTGNKKDKIRVQDIAKVLNISSSTVSRALNDHPRISKLTKEKVKQAAIRLGYQIGFPKIMNPEKAEVVAVLTPSLENEVYRDFISGITDFLAENSFQTFVVNTQDKIELATSFFDSYHKYGISGLIHIVGNRSLSQEFYSIPINTETPLVTLFAPDIDMGVSSVQPDMYDGVFKAMKHLKSTGNKRVSLLLESNNKPEDYLIASSFETAMEALDMSNNNSKVYYLGVENKSIENIIELLSETGKPQAIIVKGVVSALEIMTICRNAGLEIPGDVMLIAIGIDSCPAALANNLSLIKLPTYEMGYDAAEILLQQINNPKQGKTAAIKPVNFILKGSAIRMK